MAGIEVNFTYSILNRADFQKQESKSTLSTLTEAEQASSDSSMLLKTAFCDLMAFELNF